MKTLTVIIILLLSINLQSQNNTNKIHFDEFGKKIDAKTFRMKFHNSDTLYHYWSFIDKNKNKVNTLKNDVYKSLNLNHSSIIDSINKFSQLKIPNNATLIISYNYINALCSSKSSNKIIKSEISRRKKYYSKIKNILNESNIFLICLFEKGLILKNNTKNKKEYFFIDQKNHFRNLIFRSQSSCGSFAIIKPNGETLLRNGEFSTGSMTEHLRDENWKLFFPNKKL